MPSVYIVWDRKEKRQVTPLGVLPDASTANQAIARLKLKDRHYGDAGKAYDAVQVTV